MVSVKHHLFGCCLQTGTIWYIKMKALAQHAQFSKAINNLRKIDHTFNKEFLLKHKQD